MADPKKFDLDLNSPSSMKGGKIDLDALPTSHTPNVVPKPTEQGSAHPTAAALVRTGAGLLSSLGNWEPGLGTAVAAGVGGAGESIAEMLDAGKLDPSVIDPKRVALEATLSAIPGRSYFKLGSLAGSAVKSGAIAGAGEYARERVKGEDIDPHAILKSTAIGGVTGGVFGHFMPAMPGTNMPRTAEGAAPVVANAKPSIADLAAKHAGDVEAFTKAAGPATHGMTLDQIAKEASGLPKSHAEALRDAALQTNGQWRGPVLEKELARLESLGMHEDAQHLRMAAGRTDTGTTKIYNRARDINQRLAKQEQAARDAATKAQEARTRMEKLQESGKSRETARQTISGTDPETGEKLSHTLTVSPGKPKKGEIVGGGGAETPTLPGMPPVDPDAALKAEVQAVLAKNAPQVAGEVGHVPAPGVPEAPVVAAAAPPVVAPPVTGAPSVAPPVSPVAPVNPVVAQELAKTQEEAARAAQEHIDAGGTLGQPVPETPGVVPPVTPPPPAVTRKRGSPGDIKIPDVLTGPEKAAVGTQILHANYPPELAGQIAPLAEKYHALGDQIAALPVTSQNYAETLAGLKKSRGMLGMEMKLLTQKAEEAGVIAAGHGEATSKQIQDAITLANENKFGAQSPVGGHPPMGELPVSGVESTPIYPSDIPGGVPPVEVSGVMPPKEGIPTELPQAGSFPVRGNMEGVDLTQSPQGAVESGVSRGLQVADKLAEPGADQSGFIMGSGLGGFQDLIEKHPELAKRLGMSAAGAAIGGVTDPMDDPVMSMAMGAGVGAMAPDAIKALKGSGIKPAEVPEVAKVMSSGSPEEKKNLAVEIYHLLPNFQRFNYLMSAPWSGMGANAVAGPYGALFFGALERALAGDARGAAALRLATPTNWFREFHAGKNQALRMIEHAEAGDPIIRAEMQGSGVLGKTATRILQVPATALTSGDIASRTIFGQAGFTEDEAREMTATASKQFIPALRKLGNLARGEQSTFLSLIFPFVKTPLNLIEQGLIRTPGVGSLVQAGRVSRGALKTSGRLQATQQAIGGLMGIGGYALGSITPRDDASTLRKFATNAAGPYAAIVALGFAMGQRSNQGGEPGVFPFVQDAMQALPLPTTQSMTEGGKFIDKLLGGDVEGVQDLPRGMVPAFLREPAPYGFGPEPESPAMKKLNAKMKALGKPKKSAAQRKFDLETQ